MNELLFGYRIITIYRMFIFHISSRMLNIDFDLKRGGGGIRLSRGPRGCELFIGETALHHPAFFAHTHTVNILCKNLLTTYQSSSPSAVFNYAHRLWHIFCQTSVSMYCTLKQGDTYSQAQMRSQSSGPGVLDVTAFVIFGE